MTPVSNEEILSRYEPDLNSGCWLWSGSLKPDGYGKFSRNCKTQSAHRFFFSSLKHEIPHGFVVMHKCDTPSCVNPEHLSLGSQADNAKDRENKGRGHDRRGEKNGNSRFTQKEVLEIRADPRSKKEIAEAYRMSLASTYRIINGERYR